MVKQAGQPINVLSNGKIKDWKVEDDIIQLIDQAMNVGASEGSDEHFMATQLFVKQEYRVVSFVQNQWRKNGLAEEDIWREEKEIEWWVANVMYPIFYFSWTFHVMHLL